MVANDEAGGLGAKHCHFPWWIVKMLNGVAFVFRLHLVLGMTISCSSRSLDWCMCGARRLSTFSSVSDCAFAAIIFTLAG